MSREQEPTTWTTIRAIMGSRNFKAGFEERRAGRPPNFDLRGEVNGSWDYERGRHFALIAPLGMVLRISGKLNPKAVALYEAAWNRGYLL
jgi:hypothetical protein